MPFFKRKQDKQQSSCKLPKEPSSLKSPPFGIDPQSPDSINGDIGVPSSILQPLGISHKLVLSAEDLESLDGLAADQTGLSPKSPMKTSSRLSKTLLEVLHDKDALHCFIQFMESQQAQRFIRFWLDANSFRASTITRMRSNSLKAVESSSLLMRRNELRGSNATREEQQAGSEERVSEKMEDGGERVRGPLLASNYKADRVTSEKTRQDQQGAGSVLDELETGVSLTSTGIEGSPQNSHSPGAWSSQKPESKPCFLPLPSVDVQVTRERRGSLSTPSPVNFNLLSPQSNESSLQDSGIANSDGEQPVTPGSHSGDSMDTVLCDNKTADQHLGRSCQASPGGEAKAASRGSACQDTKAEKCAQADVLLQYQSECDISQGNNVISGVGLHSVEESDVRSSQSCSGEEIRDKLKRSIERDAVSIFTKYIAHDAEQPIGVDDSLRGETIRKICREDKQVDPECFVACQDFVIRSMQKDYYKPFTDSEYHCKHQVSVLTGGQLYLADVLYNEHALCYFMEFMEQEGGQNLMQFWMAADNFQQQLVLQEGGYDGMQAQCDAMVLYDRFFSLQATTPLGFDDNIRFEVESNICREEGPLPNCFAKPRDLVLQTIDKVYFCRYLSSDIYYRYLSDLINTVQMAQDLPYKRQHRRQASDASSEHSAGSQSLGGTEGISTRNTLLAAPSRGSRKTPTLTTSTSLPGLKLEEPLGTMATDYLHGEDLWKQPNKAPLRLGSVNALGQFVSEFQPCDLEASKKKGSGFFFKKNKTKEKEQEELAAQVAQMIISDVVNMTKMGDVCAGLSTGQGCDVDSLASVSPFPSFSFSASLTRQSLFEPPPS